MKLSCELHSRNEDFTAGEVERIVYTLQGLWQDEPDLGDEPGSWCLRDILDFSLNPEGYLEYVDGAIESRRAK